MFIFSDTDRAIFPYHDGASEVFGDPLDINRRLRFRLPNSDQLISQWEAANGVIRCKLAEADAYEHSRQADPSLPPKAIEYTPDELACIRFGQGAHEQLVVGVREVFQLPEFDRKTGQGCTDTMVIVVWNAFNSWTAKKNGTSPTTPI